MRREHRQIEANLTPMIDVTFLLIVFFVLVTQIVDLENVEMDLPTPQEAASELFGDESRAVINVVPAAGGRAGAYRLNHVTFGADPQSIELMTQTLAGLYRSNPALRVNLRADRGTYYQWVQPALEAVSAAARRSGHSEAIAGVNLVVVRED